MTKILGPVCNKLQREDMHLKYQQQILEFYRVACLHKNDECRLNAAYNLPAMNLIYRKHLDKVPPMMLSSQSMKFISQPPMTSSSSASLQVDIEESKDEIVMSDGQQGPPFNFDNCYL